MAGAWARAIPAGIAAIRMAGITNRDDRIAMGTLAEKSASSRACVIGKTYRVLAIRRNSARDAGPAGGFYDPAGRKGLRPMLALTRCIDIASPPLLRGDDAVMVGIEQRERRIWFVDQLSEGYATVPIGVKIGEAGHLE